MGKKKSGGYSLKFKKGKSKSKTMKTTRKNNNKFKQYNNIKGNRIPSNSIINRTFLEIFNK